MESIADQYLNEMHDEFHYFATWAPTETYHIGDILEKRGKNEYEYRSNLTRIGVDFEVLPDEAKHNFHYQSVGNVSISQKVTGKVMAGIKGLDIGDAGLVVQFNKEKAIAFEAAGVQHQKIADLNRLEKDLILKKKSGDWESDWVVVTDLMIADSGTVLISQGKGGTIELRAKADVPNLSLANIDAKFESAYSENMNTQIIATRGLTPLFKISQLSSRVFFPPGLKITKGSPRPSEKLEISHSLLEVKFEKQPLYF